MTVDATLWSWWTDPHPPISLTLSLSLHLTPRYLTPPHLTYFTPTTSYVCLFPPSHFDYPLNLLLFLFFPPSTPSPPPLTPHPPPHPPPPSSSVAQISDERIVHDAFGELFVATGGLCCTRPPPLWKITVLTVVSLQLIVWPISGTLGPSLSASGYNLALVLFICSFLNVLANTYLGLPLMQVPYLMSLPSYLTTILCPRDHISLPSHRLITLS